MQSIDRIPVPTKQEFEHYLNPDRPVIINGLIDQWPAANRWTPDYLADVAGERMLPAVTITDGDYANAETTNITARDYLKHIACEEPTQRRRLYLAELPTHKYLPELLSDVEFPDHFFAPRERSPKSAFYVGKLSFSQLHYHDRGSALLNILHGKKRIRLYPPSESKYLYLYPAKSNFSNMSRTTREDPDPEVYPRFSAAQYVDLVLEKGETLFIPIFWWHAITNLEDVTVAIVMYWDREFWRRFPPQHLRATYFYKLTKQIQKLARSLPDRIRNKLVK